MNTSLPFGKSHAYVIGIANYQYNAWQLKTPVNDARAMEALFSQQLGFHVTTLIDPGSAQLRELFQQIRTEVTEEDSRVLLYYAGHGIQRDSAQGLKGYLVPADAEPVGEGNMVPMEELSEVLNGLPSRHVMLILDCCFAGTFRTSAKRSIGYVESNDQLFRQHYDIYTGYSSRLVLTSTSHRQKAFDRFEDDDPNSPFARTLLQGLSGEADYTKDRLVTAAELNLYLADKLGRITEYAGNLQSVGLDSMDKDGEGQFLFFLDGFAATQLPEQAYENPYKGLKSYEPGDTGLFFGRTKATQALMDIVTAQPFVIVVGASGTGKSSLVKAGIVPRLKQLTDTPVPIIRPGKNPMEALTAVEDWDILVIDQWEEVITQAEHDEEVEQFYAEVRRLIDSGKRIIGTVRADFEAQTRQQQLEPHWTEGRFVVPAFTSEEYHDIIVQPAKRVACLFENDDLVQAIEQEVAQQPGPLPLLSFMLAELFERAKREVTRYREIQWTHYREVGGVSGALRNKAEEVYDGLPDTDHQLTMRHLMLRMVALSTGEMAGKRVLLSELDFGNPAEDQRVQTVVQSLDEGKLVRRDANLSGHRYIEPAHDALVRAWGRLWDWVKEAGQENLLLRAKLSAAVSDYQLQNDNKDFLWNNDPRLDQVKALMAQDPLLLNQAEQAFTQTSIREKGRRRRRIIAIVTSVIIGLLGLVAVAYMFKLDADTEAKNALEARDAEALGRKKAEYSAKVNQLASRAKQVAGSDYSLAWHLGVTAWQMTMDSARGGVAEPSVQTIMHDIVSDPAGMLYTALEHSEEDLDILSAASFSPDGSVVVTVGEGMNTVYWWNKDGTLRKKSKGHPENVDEDAGIYAMAFSPVCSSDPTGGKYLLTYGDGACLWDRDGKLIKALEPASKEIARGLFSRDGKYVITTSDDGAPTRLWDTNGNLLKEFNEHPGGCFTEFSPDGKSLITWDDESGNLFLRDAKGSVIKKLNNDDDDAWRFGVGAIRFSPAGLILVAAAEGNIRLWDKTGNLLKAWQGHRYAIAQKNEDIESAAFLPEGLIVSCSEHILELWDKNGKRQSGVTEQFQSTANERLLVSPNGKSFMVLNGKDNSAAIYQLGERENAQRSFDLLKRLKSGIISVNFSSDGKYFFAGHTDGAARLYDQYGNLIKELKGHPADLVSVQFSPDGQSLLTADEDGMARIWVNHTGQLGVLSAGEGYFTGALYSPDGKTILTTHKDKSDGELIYWDRKGILQQSLKVKNASFRPVSFLSDNGRVLLVDDNGRIVVWDNKIGEFNMDFLETKDDGYKSVTVAPDGKSFVSIKDGKVQRWDMNGKNPKNLAEQKVLSIRAVSAPDGESILTADEDNIARLYDKNGKVVTTLKGHSGYLNDVAISPDGQFMLTAGADRTARLWNRNGELIKILKGHTQEVRSVAFSPDGLYLLTGSNDQTACIWDKNGNQLMTLNGHEGTVYSAEFSPDGQTILTMSSDGTARIWESFPVYLANSWRMSKEALIEAGVEENIADALPLVGKKR